MTQDQGGDLPRADDTVALGRKTVLRFHPLGKRIKDGTVRCFGCGQIDEDGYHDDRWCPIAGGDLPFPTSTLKLTLKADSGFRSESSYRLTLRQWVEISRILNQASEDAQPLPGSRP